jgi:hypothetical protein
MTHSETKRLRRASVASRVGREFTAVLTRLVDHLLLWMAEQMTVLGVQLSSFSLQQQYRPVFFGRVQRALELIARYEPRRFERIRRDVGTIRGIAGGPNFYQHAGRAIHLSLPTVLSTSSADLAMTIVHEATHGRIDDRGIQYYNENRARIEAACVRQEAIFARSLPGGEALAESEVKKLENPWWSDQALDEGRLRLAEAEELPAWLIRHIERRLARRAARVSGT